MRMQDIRRLVIPQTEFQNTKINDAKVLKEIQIRITGHLCQK